MSPKGCDTASHTSDKSAVRGSIPRTGLENLWSLEERRAVQFKVSYNGR